MPAPAQDAPRLVVVSGAGRSGTSTAAGTLAHLGVHSPQPSITSNASNPRGFFEPRWSVKFHNRLLARAEVDLTDGRPYALDLVTEAIDDDQRRRLRAWLGKQTAGHAQTVVKDPRTVWALGLWHATATELGLQVSDLIMLRHPAEVHRSRATHYAARRERAGTSFVATNLAGWVNANLMAERASRGSRRIFVPYAALVEDWRSSVRRLEAALDLSLPVDAAAATRVDGFVDPALRRSAPSWDGIEAPAFLLKLADEVWDALGVLADAPDGRSPDAEATLDRLADSYAVQYAEAEAVTWYTEVAAERRGRRLQRREDTVAAASVAPATPARALTDRARDRLRAVAPWGRRT